MKKSMILAGMLAIGYTNAQTGNVGINTDTPKATLNVKSKTGTTATTKNMELENANGTKMVTVLDNGHIGIGTDKPDARVHILSEGTPGASGPRGGNDWIYDYYENGTTATADPTGMYFRRYGGKIGALSNLKKDTHIGEFVYQGYYADALKTISNIRTTYTGDGTTATARLHMGILGSNTDLVINRDTDGGTTNIGIGTNTPTQKLDVNGNARVRQMPNGSDEATYSNVVVADANGNLAVVNRTNPSLPNSTQTIFGTKQRTDVAKGDTFYDMQRDWSNKGSRYYRYTGQSITLPPGKWIVYNAYLVRTPTPLKSKLNTDNTITSQYVWVRAIIDDTPEDVLKATHLSGAQIKGSPALISTNISPDQYFNMANGLWFVDNTTNADKTYYVKVSFAVYNFTETDTQTVGDFSNYDEEYLVAIRRD